jgi:hypothetical protein
MLSKTSDKKIDRAFELFCDIRSSLDAKNWSQQLRHFLNEFSSFSGNDFEERIFSGWVAAMCEQAYYTVAHRKDLGVRKKFENELKKIFSANDIPHCLVNSKFVICGKKQPAVIDSIDPTFDRFRVLEKLPKIFGNAIDSIILGGSMSYVPFLGVRSDHINNDYSDIDLIFIQSDSFFNKASWNDFRNTTALYPADKKVFLERVNEYKRLFSEGRADIISQRFKIKGKKYTISIHFFPKTIFKKLVNSELSKKIKTMDECNYVVRNYRTDAFFHPCQARLSFDGSRIESGIWPESSNVKYGHIVSTSGFTIKNKKLYPGPFLTVALPALNVFNAKSSFAKGCLEKLERILNKQTSYIFECNKAISYAKAHHRYYLFCPGRYDDGHDSFVSPKEAAKLYIINPLTIQTLCISEDNKGSNAQQEPRSSSTNNKIAGKLEHWKQEELAAMSTTINSFLKGGIQENMDISSFRNSRWLTVATVKAKSNIIFNNADNTRFLATYMLSPDDIMSTLAYSKLNNKYGKVYISSNFDPIDSESIHPKTYSIIVKLC